MTMSGVTAGLRANAASALSASNRGTEGAPTVMQRRRMLCYHHNEEAESRASSLVICNSQQNGVGGTYGPPSENPRLPARRNAGPEATIQSEQTNSSIPILRCGLLAVERQPADGR